MKYKSGFKYQLHEDETTFVDIHPEVDIDREYIRLSTDGYLLIRKGYAWDGPSGPTIDTKNFMRGSLVHDALYQLMRNGQLLPATKAKADQVLVEICRADGMSAIRAWWVLKGLKFAKAATLPRNRKVVQEAP